MKTVASIASLVVLATVQTAIGQAADPPAVPAGYFPFTSPRDDVLAGVATDVSFLNSAPAGKDGRIVVRDGQFVQEDTGERVRFFGANIGANDAFPTKPDAERIARKLAKMGVNVVRLHHLDNVWTIGQGGTLWDASRPDHQVFDPNQLDKLDYLVSELKKNGIYVNLNLKVSKELSVADGMPESIKDVKFTHQKRIDFYNRRMIDLQKDYARRLLAHKNPYTGMAYTEDPAVAFVEINNENALLGYWTSSLGEGLDVLPEPFLGDLSKLWTQWLTRKYGDDAALKAAWEASTTPPGPSILGPANTWQSEQHGDAVIAITPTPRPAGVNSPPDLQADVQKIDDVGWHLQTKVSGLTLNEGDSYTLRFRAKADRGRSIGVTSGLDVEPWTNFGLNAQATLTEQWQSFSFAFRATGTKPDLGRLAFLVGDTAGKIWISDLSLSPGLSGAGVVAGQSLATGMAVPGSKRPIQGSGWVQPPAGTEVANANPGPMTPVQRSDWVQFLTDTEVAYADEMLDFLKKDLGAKANIALSQIDYGGVSGMVRERRMDFTDSHAYWQHPNFTGGAWNPASWTINNTPQVNAMVGEGFGEFRRLAMGRVAGKPYSVSEYDHPAPSDFASEMMPTYAAFGGIQDWDIIYTFAVANYTPIDGANRIEGYFDQLNHPGKAAFYPATALMFRRGLIPPAPGTAVMQIPEPYHDFANVVEVAWDKSGGLPVKPYLTHRLSVRDRGEKVEKITVTVDSGDPPPAARVLANDAGAVLVAASPSAVSVAGFIGGTTVNEGPVNAEIGKFGNGFAAYMVVPIEDKPIAASDKVLLTVAGRVENSGMGWNAARTSVSTNWGTGPTIAEFVPATFSVQSVAAKAVYPLDEYGKRKTAIESTYEGGAVRFKTDPSHQTLWYELATD